MTPLEVEAGAGCEGSGSPQVTVPPPPPPLQPAAATFVPKTNGSSSDSSSTLLLLEDIRSGVALKPTKTHDKSTAAFIKKSNGVNVEQPRPSTEDCSREDVAAIEGVKDALQEELRNTLKRKVKKQDVERGDPSKNHEIEKAMELNRTEVALKVNLNSAVTEPSTVGPAKPPRAVNGHSELPRQLVKSPAASVVTTNGTAKKPEPMVIIRPFVSSASTSLNGTLRKVGPQKELKIDVSGSADNVKRSILSPEVRSGNAAIRPSQIKTLTKQGSLVSHTDIVEDAKPISKSPISLVETPKPPPVSASAPPSPIVKTITAEPVIKSSQSSPRTPTTRNMILDTRIGGTNGSGIKSPILSPKSKIALQADPPKRLLISHPKASFTLPRTKSQKSKPTSAEGSDDTKPVFRILTQLEKSEQQEQQKTVQQSGPAEPAAKSYVSFAKELANATNNYPDTAVKTTTVGVVKEDVFFGNTNLRDIKIDIVENGQLRVTNK